MLIPKNTSVLIRRVPGRPRLPIVTEIEYYLKPLISLLQLKISELIMYCVLDFFFLKWAVTNLCIRPQPETAMFVF